MIPQLSVPVYDLPLPSTGKTIKARPFLVKEEKLLLMAAQSKDTTEIINMTKQVISNCLVEKKIRIDDLSFFDVDYLFIALRAKSVGETIEVNFKCNNRVDNDKCDTIFPVTLDISQIALNKNDDIKDQIFLTDKTGVKLKYPKYGEMKKIIADESALDKRIRVIQASIDYIFDDKQTYPAKDMTKEELDEFTDNLTQAQLEKLGEWVDNFPEFSVVAKQKCPKCNFEHTIQYKDYTSFFL